MFKVSVCCLSSQMLAEPTEDNLIDLGPGSPAVVTPRVVSSPSSSSAHRATASPAHNPSTASISTALASLGRGKVRISFLKDPKNRKKYLLGGLWMSVSSYNLVSIPRTFFLLCLVPDLVFVKCVFIQDLIIFVKIIQSSLPHLLFQM